GGDAASERGVVDLAAAGLLDQAGGDGTGPGGTGPGAVANSPACAMNHGSAAAPRVILRGDADAASRWLMGAGTAGRPECSPGNSHGPGPPAGTRLSWRRWRVRSWRARLSC